ncbi:type IV pilus biogenesis protein PilM [Chengkuizengella axinellae]|uniref:Pilus assembly protein PilM n=1 Tax=Chengkuizengella axinellae TaxID=3064388 RepID=A0ABT9IZV9_9BACL|nr:pilus assembly protein PilM [Chengkuizengella sp. 2205SS18-9]MDP5274304.1 pilus assembly protein PilM [Chengkuizengella sp. 2205SS18-9]
MVSFLPITSVNIGLTITSTGIRYVQLKAKKIVKTGFLPIEEGLIFDDEIQNFDILLAKIKPWIKQEKLTGKSIHICIPSTKAYIRSVEMPPAKGKMLKQMIQLEIETSIQLPFENPIYDYVILDQKKEDQNQVLVVAAPSSLVESYVMLFQKAGLKIKTVDLSSLSLYRVTNHIIKDIPQNLLLVYLTNENVEILLFHHGVPEFTREVSILDLFKNIDEDPDHEWKWGEIQSEIYRMVQFFENHIHEGAEQITDILLLGAYPNKDQLIKYLNEFFDGISIGKIDLSESLILDKVDFTIPYGLALKGMVRK